jgi:alanine dehydrogenase
VIELAQRGIEKAAMTLRPIARAMNVYAGEVTNKAVAETFGLPLSTRFAT